MVKKAIRQTIGLAGLGLAGAGLAKAAASTGTSTGASVASGIGAAGDFIPVAGTIIGTGLTVRMTMGMAKDINKRMKRKY